MPLTWYITLVVVAGACAVGDQVLRGRFARPSFAASLALGLIGTLMGWALGSGLALPEPVHLSVSGRPFPLFWSFVGSAVFLGTLDLVERRARRRRAAA